MSKRFIISAENRQHINLSTNANQIIELDMMRFNDDYELRNKSGFINTIIANYYDKFPLSEAVALEQINIVRKAVNTDSVSDRAIKQVIDVFSEEMMKNTIQKFANGVSYDVSFKLKLDQQTTNLLAGVSTAQYFEDYAPRSGLGFYIKAILESYVNLPRKDREQIFFRKIVEKINKTIDENGFIVYRTNNEQYKISPSAVGYLENSSSLVVEYEFYDEKTDSTYAMMKKSVKELAKSHPTYIANPDLNATKKVYYSLYEEKTLIPNYDFVVEFSENGLEMFLHDEHNLTIIGVPSPENPCIYTFHTNEVQFFNNLFKYGVEMRVLQPTFAQSQFKKLYDAAANNQDN